MKKIQCINATNGLRLTGDGNIMMCCMSRQLLTDKDGEIIDVKTNMSPISSAMAGKKYIEIQTALNNGIRHKNCERCWHEEDAGVVSKRIRDTNAFQYQSNDASVRIIELNLGTECNLKCRICGPWSSSRWNKEYQHIEKYKSPEEYKTWISSFNHNYDDNTQLWDDLKLNLGTIEKIDMYGGEPFVIKKQWELLQYSVDQGYSKNQILQFNTNGTYIDESKSEILKHFKEVYISVSVDGIERQFEYQRHPAKWSEVLSNIFKFQNLTKDNNIVLHVCITLNMYNIFFLDEIFKFFHENNIRVQINYLHEPLRWNVKNLRQDIKHILTKKYQTISISENCDQWIRSAVDYMNSAECNTIFWNEFIEVTEKLDIIRKESFKDVFFEFYKIIYEK